MYTRLKKSNVWHWHPECSNFPTSKAVVVSQKKPTNGELCDECTAKDKPRAADQDTAIEKAFVAGTLPEVDRREPETVIVADVEQIVVDPELPTLVSVGDIPDGGVESFVVDQPAPDAEPEVPLPIAEPQPEPLPPFVTDIPPNEQISRVFAREDGVRINATGQIITPS